MSAALKLSPETISAPPVRRVWLHRSGLAAHLFYASSDFLSRVSACGSQERVTPESWMEPRHAVKCQRCVKWELEAK